MHRAARARLSIILAIAGFAHAAAAANEEFKRQFCTDAERGKIGAGATVDGEFVDVGMTAWTAMTEPQREHFARWVSICLAGGKDVVVRDPESSDLLAAYSAKTGYVNDAAMDAIERDWKERHSAKPHVKADFFRQIRARGYPCDSISDTKILEGGDYTALWAVECAYSGWDRGKTTYMVNVRTIHEPSPGKSDGAVGFSVKPWVTPCEFDPTCNPNARPVE